VLIANYERELGALKRDQEKGVTVSEERMKELAERISAARTTWSS